MFREAGLCMRSWPSKMLTQATWSGISIPIPVESRGTRKSDSFMSWSSCGLQLIEQFDARPRSAEWRMQNSISLHWRGGIRVMGTARYWRGHRLGHPSGAGDVVDEDDDDPWSPRPIGPSFSFPDSARLFSQNENSLRCKTSGGP